ncbi:MAG: hypothetical protein ACPGXZ_11295 [Saprospiraceae bacterium]|mgnify:FL=1
MKNIIIKILSVLALVFVLNAVTPTSAVAQCPMCKIAAESNYKHGGSSGRGLNAGILYMLATPYVLIGGLAFVWWRNRRNSEDEDEMFELEN